MKLKIVLLTGSNPYNNSGIMAYDMFKSLKNDGHTIQLLTRQYDSRFEFGMRSVYGRNLSIVDEFIRKLKNKFDLRKKDPEYCMQSLDEFENYIPTKKILKKIPFTPDVFLYLFPHRFLNAKNLFELNKKTGAAICVFPVDMAQFTGGCHYVNSCEEFKKSCGSCPGLYSHKDKDLSNSILTFRAKYISKTQDLYTVANSWTSDYIKQSTIFQGKPNFLINEIINETDFFPGNKNEAKNFFGVPTEKRVIFFGATAVHEKRKGFDYLVNAINLLYEKINDKQKEEIVIAIAGKVDSRISHLFPFQVFELGYLSPNHLVNAYRMADVFISPSIQDTGPLMVLQSLMCGTAVVTFEMGNSQEFVHNYKTGFQAPLYDSEKLMEGLMYFLTRTEIESLNISKDCRNFAVENASYNYFSKVFIQIYNNFLLLNK